MQNCPSQRVLVIGLDGATYDVLTPLSQAGVMPNLAALMRRAALVALQSTRPCITPVAWTSFQTGNDPEHHGILDYRYLDHRERALRLNSAERIRTTTLFDAVAAAGGQMVSLNLPMTWPASANSHGLIVGGLDCPSIAAALAPYPRFAARLKASGAAFDLRPHWKQTPASFEELSANVAATQADFGGRATAAEIADELVDWQLMIIQFQTLDELQHRAWDLLGIDPACNAPAAWIAKVREAMRTLDECVGRLIELAARRDAAVVVVSDHGFGPFREKISLPLLLASRGLLALPGVARRCGDGLRHIGWRAQKWWHRQRRPGTSTASLVRPLAGQLPVDWRRTRAVTLHGSLGAMIYLNDPRRFGRGPITTRRLEDQAIAECLAALREARHPETEEQLFVEAFSTRERFGCDPLDRQWPDVIGIPAPGFHTRSKLDPFPSLLQTDANLTGTHRQEGVLMIDSPGIPLGDRRTADMRDVAPTILSMLGIPAPASMTGKSLIPSSLVTRRVDAEEPAVRVPSFAAASDLAEQAQVESRLRALGYLE